MAFVYIINSYITIRGILGGTLAKGGDPNSKKLGFLGHKTPNFRRRRRRKFVKIEGIKKNQPFFGVLWEIWPDFDLYSHFRLIWLQKQ